MLIKDGVWPGSTQVFVKLDGQYREVVSGYSKIDGVWVPWDFAPDGDVEIGVAVANKTLNGLTLILSKVLPET